MNRTHIEGAAAALAGELGYEFHTGPEEEMTHAIRSYPAAWLAPLELNAVEGRSHGRATYDLTLHLLRQGAKLTPSQRRGAMAALEEDAFAFFAALSRDKRVIAVEKLSLHVRSFALTPHGELAQTATARIVTFF